MDYFLKTSALLFLFFMVYRLCLQKETFFGSNRWFLLTGLFTSFLLPLIVIPVYETQVITIPALEAPTRFAAAALVDGSLEDTGAVAASPAFDWTNFIVVLYWIGVTVFTARFMMQLAAVLRIILSGERKSFPTFTIIETPKNVSPFSFFKTIIYNPEHLSGTAVDQILIHEKVHVRDWHSVDGILSELALIVMWFNPLIWWYQKSLKQNLEFIADAQSLKQVACAKTYQTVLVSQSLPNYQMALVNNFHSSFLKKRIMMLNKSKSKPLQQLKMAFVIPFLSLFLFNFSTEIRTEIITEVNPPAHDIGAKNPKIQLRNTLKIVFTKETTQESFEDIKATLKNEGVAMDILEIARAENNDITKIHIKFTTANGSANYNVADKNGIGSFQFQMLDDGSFSVGAVNTSKLVTGSKVVTGGGVVSGYRTNLNSNNTKVWHMKDSSQVNSIILDSTANHAHFIIREADTIVFEDADFLVKPNALHDSAFVLKMDSLSLKYTIDTSPYVFITKPHSAKSHTKTMTIRGHDDNKPLIIVNGKPLDSQNLHEINPNQIKSVTVLKGKSALALYGSSGTNGVMIITTKSSWQPKGGDKAYVVSGIVDLVDGHYTAPPTLYKIDKLSTGIELDKLKEKLESSGLNVRYSKIKRNELGEIIGIKISLSDKSGNKSAATFKSDDGISTIYFGKHEDNLIVSSNPPR